ncbi:MAG: type II toxin-antitoxin system PemK/MazF family toxin [Deltaproteobacteria bacterium]|nr:type II toxin-antitoxin system PemK/MazF family toxin [Deltaproteobacteria bacterium]
MPLRGEVYFPAKNLPPDQDTPHRCVVLSPTNLMAHHPNVKGNKLFVVVAIIRSATHQSGTPVRLVPGHSVPITVTDFSFLDHDSIVETHQLFAVELDVFRRKHPMGRISGQVLTDILRGAQRLFS